jgi:hypothetical protein
VVELLVVMLTLLVPLVYVMVVMADVQRARERGCGCGSDAQPRRGRDARVGSGPGRRWRSR